MPDRKVQGVCDVANATFPNGCTNAQLNTLKRSSAQAVLDYFKNTLELNCNYNYLVENGITERWVRVIIASFDEYWQACKPDWELYTNIYRSQALRSDFKNIYPIEYHPAYDYLFEACFPEQLKLGCWPFFEKYNARQILIWEKNQNAAEPEAVRLLQLALKISIPAAAADKAEQQKKDAAALAVQQKKDAAALAVQQKKAAAALAVQQKKDAAASKAANEKIKASGGCQIYKSNSWTANGGWYNFPEGSRQCTKGKWSNPYLSPSTGGSSSNNSKNRTLVSKTCDLRAGAASSDWYGQSYSWTIWNNWSDGSKTVAIAGSGYANSVPSGC